MLLSHDLKLTALSGQSTQSNRQSVFCAPQYAFCSVFGKTSTNTRKCQALCLIFGQNALHLRAFVPVLPNSRKKVSRALGGIRCTRPPNGKHNPMAHSGICPNCSPCGPAKLQFTGCSTFVILRALARRIFLLLCHSERSEES